jgi:hydrogenase-4 component E
MENALIILFGLTMLYMAVTSRIMAHIRILVLQGVLLFLVYFFGAEKTSMLNFLFLAFETLIVKSLVIPMFLNKVVKSTHEYRDADANIPHFYCLFISTIILFVGFLISDFNFPAIKLINPIYFGVSISVIIISLLLITIKHKILTNVLSFITMENGIFLLSLSVVKEMPIIVNLGVLLDLFIAVFILGLLVNHINKEFDGLEVSHLTDLKDCEYDD